MTIFSFAWPVPLPTIQRDWQALCIPARTRTHTTIWDPPENSSCNKDKASGVDLQAGMSCRDREREREIAKATLKLLSDKKINHALMMTIPLATKNIGVGM